MELMDTFLDKFYKVDNNSQEYKGAYSSCLVGGGQGASAPPIFFYLRIFFWLLV